MIEYATINHPDDIETGFNELIEQSCEHQKPQQLKHQLEYDNIWFKTCENPELFPPIQLDIYDQILHFKRRG